jgi:hypothetical protein
MQSLCLKRGKATQPARSSFMPKVMKSPGLKPIEAQNARSSSAWVPNLASTHRKRCELPRPPGCYARVLKRVGMQYCRISSTTAGMSL